MRRSSSVILFALALLLAACGSSGTPAPQEISGAGSDVASLVDQFRAAFGGENNGGEPQSFEGGYREVNWDTLPDDLSSPADYASDHFNASEAPLARGLILTTSGTLRVSADADNPTSTAPGFAELNPSYTAIFTAFSPERMFSPVGSNVVEVTFRLAGTDTPAAVRGFGAVALDVDTDATTFEYLDASGASLAVFFVPVSQDGLSFLGVIFDDPVVATVRLTLGTDALGPDDGGDVDVVVLDNFIYGEPH